MNAAAHAPHAHGGKSIRGVMTSVMLALTPLTLWGFYLFGWTAVWLWLLTVGSAMLFELVCLNLAKRGGPASLLDGSAALAGWLLALTLPPWAPWWIAVLGSFIAIAVAKHGDPPGCPGDRRAGQLHRHRRRQARVRRPRPEPLQSCDGGSRRPARLLPPRDDPVGQPHAVAVGYRARRP